MPEKDSNQSSATLVLFNKPFRVMSQFSKDPGSEKETLADYIPIKDVYPAGRLDFDSEGLLALTDNGILNQFIANPRHKKYKAYLVQVEGEISKAALSKLANGIELKDGMTKPARVEKIPDPELWERNPPIRKRKDIPTSWIRLAISEGKNRQVRRMTAATGFPTLRLIREKIDRWSVSNIKPGEYKVLQVDLKDLNIEFNASSKNHRDKGNKKVDKGNKGVNKNPRKAKRSNKSPNKRASKKN